MEQERFRPQSSNIPDPSAGPPSMINPHEPRSPANINEANQLLAKSVQDSLDEIQLIFAKASPSTLKKLEM